MTTLGIALSVASGVSYANDFANASTQAEYEYSRLTSPLVAAGINPHSEDELIKALTSRDSSIQVPAVRLLKRDRRYKAIIPLRLLLKSPNDSLRLDVCDALQSLHDSGYAWMPICTDLLKSTDFFIRSRAAGLLARQGDSQGWSIVKEMLVSNNDPLVYQAAGEAPFFQGLSIKSDGKVTHINVLAVCIEAFRQADEKSQMPLYGPIARLAKRQDIPQLNSLLPVARTPYIKDSIIGLIKSVERAK